MFTSNQVLNISSSYKELKKVLEFVLNLSGDTHMFLQTEYDRGCRLVYKIVGNSFVLGWQFKDVEKNWKEFSQGYPPTIELIEQNILAFLKNAKYPENEYECFDGFSDRGFRCYYGEIPRERFASNAEHFMGNMGNFYSIAVFEPFWNYYSK